MKYDLGHNHSLSFFCWKPDRKLNPQLDGIPDIEKAGASIEHPSKQDGSPCISSIMFKNEATSKVFSDKNSWAVESWEPLTISPSLLCKCGDHGFIR